MAGYFANLGKPNCEEVFCIQDVGRFLQTRGSKPTIPSYVDAPEFREVATRENLRRYLAIRRRVKTANELLAERKLIKLYQHEADSVFTVQLTLEGFDIGRECNSYSGEIQFLWRKFRDQWWAVPIAFLFGSIATGLVAWLFK